MKRIALSLLLLLMLVACAGKVSAFPQGPYSLPTYPGVEKTTKIEGINIVYIDEGQGDPILFVHGLSGDMSDWNYQIVYFKKTHRVLALDLPGHGKSEKRNDIPYGREMYTKVVSQFLKERGVEKAIVVGHSMGGLISASLTIAHPEQVDKLVLLAAAGVNNISPFLKGVARLVSPGMAHIVFSSPKYIAKSSEHSFYDPSKYPEQRIKEDIAIAQAPDSKNYSYAVIKSLKNILKQDLEPDMAKIKCPTLIIWGDHDTTVNPEAAQVWHKGIAGSQLVIVKNARHCPNFEAPEVFNAALEKFIAGAQ